MASPYLPPGTSLDANAQVIIVTLEFFSLSCRLMLSEWFQAQDPIHVVFVI